MAPPRFQCLNLVRKTGEKALKQHAAFSTTKSPRADKPPPARSYSVNSLLESVGTTSKASRAAGSSSSAFTHRPNLNTNPISLPEEPRKVKSNTEHLARLIARRAESRQALKLMEQQKAKTVGQHFLSQDFSKQITRRWRAGDVYAPHDLSGVEMAKWKRRTQPIYDVFDVLNFNPEQHYRNFTIMSEYMTPMGRIKSSTETGLRPVNQRRIARAIRRSIGLGLMPSVHRHPELSYLNKQRSDMITPRAPPPGMKNLF